ncbi:MAG: RagB/SusD family nutrient uptake outer membrane protein [Chitinophagaceae bacterium]|nr:RagB/SusD family nutrient uptake outer membrane protein [Chitinophagaceae bacterium]
MKFTAKYITAVLFASAVFSSCKKTVEIDPTHTINGDNFFTKVDDYDFALTGAYQKLKQNSLYSGVNGGSVWLAGPDLAGDNFYSGGSANLGNLNTLYRWNYTADEPVVQNAWDAAYLVIQQANLAMRGIDRFRASDALKVNRIEGQARVIRAHAHLELLRWWAPDFDRASTSLGIAYVDKFDVEQMPARLTVSQSYDKIEADVKAAKSMLLNTDRAIQSASSKDGTARAYADAIVCDAILARMFLYANQLDSAIKYSTFVINARPLATPDEFFAIWEDASTSEVVWSLKYQAGNAALIREIYQVSNDRSSWLPVTALLNLYGATDIRYDAYWTNIANRTVLTKYFAKPTAAANPDGVVDAKLYRTAESYLIRAEAYARKGGMDAAGLADLNTLRAARLAATGTETGATLRTAIQTERRKELVAEGHRFFDLKRTTRVVSRTQDCSIYCTLPSTDRGWALPVPRTEMLANPNMVQNPGY